MPKLPPLETDQELLETYPVPEVTCEACGKVPLVKIWGPYRVEWSYWAKVWRRILGRDVGPMFVEGTFEVEITCNDYAFTAKPQAGFPGWYQDLVKQAEKDDD